MGITQARFVLDNWHLIDSGLRKKFGDHGHNLLKSHHIHLVKLTSNLEFETLPSAAKELINLQELVDGNLPSTLNQRSSLIHFLLYGKIPGNCGLLGSAAAEQNHASILIFLNNGGNLIKDLLQCQHNHVKKNNELARKAKNSLLK